MFRWLVAGSLVLLGVEVALFGPSLIDPPAAGAVTPAPEPQPIPEEFRLSAELVAEAPGPLTDVAGDPQADRLYLVEKVGKVWVVEDGVLLPEPFLDLSEWVLSAGNEQGLVSFELHPDYAENRRGFIFYTDLVGDSQLVELTASADYRRAELGSLRLILDIPQWQQYHQSGSISFAPDGLMLVSVGDGGGIGDPRRRGQDPSNIFATIIRVGVDGSNPYEIPRDNPYVGTDDGLAEIWAYGVRNPWRISIDAPQDLLIIPDVGQEGSEEINIVPLAMSGLNFGWSVTEGTLCYQEDPCDTEGIHMPVYEYFHEGDGCAIVGGDVYRGQSMPEISGHYFYGDYCLGWIRSFSVDGIEVSDHTDWRQQLGRLGHITSFGTDRHGEIYVTNLEGELWKLVRGE